MKLATFEKDGQERLGIVDAQAGTLIDATSAAGGESRAAYAFASMLDLIDGGEAALEAARTLADRHAESGDFLYNLADIRLLAPLPQPRQMRDGMSFPTHILQAGTGRGRDLAAARAAGDMAEVGRIEARALSELPEVYRQVPIYYFTNRLAVGAPESTVVWPRYSSVMDYELEFGIVTGKSGKNIAQEKARQHIFGYTIFNDFSARDRQMIEMQGRLGPAKGKSFDGGNVLGPWIVTADEIEDPYALKMTARINGDTVCEEVSKGMLFSFEEMLAYISQDEGIVAGEFLGSGTVGNGCGLENGHFLADGDVIELEVEKIGVLRNTVVAARS